ncbi:hypothetical protein BD626DRAFT_201037 [Schizophyllum amplum]|uniref:Uncharacterized protein n=1 Tax=Schizophyllum amplum TaxID=97359 RepID=A0A550CND3_9AGAR|nr:hypothetical protein BD626DRAFT_201037 [Auriculariopsis ampla]
MRTAHDSPHSQDNDILHEDSSIPALLLTFPTPELPHSPILAPQLPFRLPFEDDVRPDSQTLAHDDHAPLALDTSPKLSHQRSHRSISEDIVKASRSAQGPASSRDQDPSIHRSTTMPNDHVDYSDALSDHFLSPLTAPPSPPRCTHCGFGFGYSLALVDLSVTSVDRPRSSISRSRFSFNRSYSSADIRLANSVGRLHKSSPSIASFNSTTSSVVPLKPDPCELCEPQWTACKVWYAARGRRLREPASQGKMKPAEGKAKKAEGKTRTEGMTRWLSGWDTRRGKKKDGQIGEVKAKEEHTQQKEKHRSGQEYAEEHKSQWFSDSMKRSRSVNEFGIMGRPWRSFGQASSSAPAATVVLATDRFDMADTYTMADNRDMAGPRHAMLGDDLDGAGVLGNSVSMGSQLQRTHRRSSAHSDASVVRRIRRLFVTESRWSGGR